MRIPRVLSIAGTDPTGGAGIQADLKSVAANGGYGMCVVTAMVAQNTHGVRSVHVPPVDFLAEQLDAVSDDVTIDAVKIGMLGSVDVIGVVQAWLERVKPPVVVLDPVMISTSGHRLLDDEAERALRDALTHADLVTPNIPELAVLCEQPVAHTWSDVLDQARELSRRHGVMVLAKGGHLDGDDAPDALVDAHGRRGEYDVVEFPGRRIDTTNTHGTGCSLSSAIATITARTGSWTQAVGEAKRWLAESIAHGAQLNVGSGHGPVSHFAGLWARGGLTTRPSADHVRDEWWSGIAEIRRDIEQLDFIRALGDGTLEPRRFTDYLAQDAIYLVEYSRVVAGASRLAPTVEEQSFWTAGAHSSLVGERQLHVNWLADQPYHVEPTATQVTQAYLNHLAACVDSGDYRVLIAALLPCYWIYADVGQYLGQYARDEHPYREWLLTYADPVFARSAESAVKVVTGHAAQADDATRTRMWRAFEQSAKFELDFFAG